MCNTVRIRPWSEDLNFAFTFEFEIEVETIATNIFTAHFDKFHYIKRLIAAIDGHTNP